MERSALGSATAASAGAGAAVTSALATACCVGPTLAPIVVAALGAGGAAWAAGLKPYAPYLLGGAFAALVLAFWMAYRPRDGCRTQPSLLVRSVLWGSTALWIASVAANLAWA